MTLRLSLIALAVVLILSGGLYVRHLQGEVRAQRQRAETAEKAEQLAKATTNIVERYHQTERVIVQKAEESAHVVEQIQSDDVPADVLSAWNDGLRNVHAAADHSGSDKPSPTVR